MLEPMLDEARIPRTPWRFVLALALFTGSASTLFAAVAEVKILTLAAFGAAAAAFLFFHPRIAFLLLALFVPTQFWWTDELRFLPRALAFADDALLALLSARVVFDRLRAGRPFARTPWDLPFFIFFGIGIISTFVNGVPFVNAAAGLRAPVLFGLLLFFVANAPHLFDRQYMTWVWRMLTVLAGLQLFTGLYQFGMRGFIADALTGTLGLSGANDLGMFLLPFLFFLASLWFDARARSPWIVAGLLTMTTAFFLCGARAAWIVAVPTIALLWGRRLLRPRVLLVALPVAAVIVALVGRIILAQGARSLERAVGLEGIIASLFLVSSGGGSFAYYPIVWRLVTTGSPLPFVGLGPGMVSSTAAAHLHAPIYQNVLYDYFGQSRFKLDAGVESQILATAGEFGPIGFLAALALLLLWIRLAWKTYRSAASPYDRALAAGLLAATLGAVSVIPIKNSWETPHLAFSVWMCGAVLYARLMGRPAPPEEMKSSSAS